MPRSLRGAGERASRESTARLFGDYLARTKGIGLATFALADHERFKEKNSMDGNNNSPLSHGRGTSSCRVVASLGYRRYVPFRSADSAIRRCPAAISRREISKLHKPSRPVPWDVFIASGLTPRHKTDM